MQKKEKGQTKWKCNPRLSRDYKEAKAYNRRRENLMMSAILGLKGNKPRYREGRHRPAASATTNTCCPERGIPLDPGSMQPVPKSTDWRAEPGDLAKPCHRGVYGITKKCETELNVRILECTDCACMPNGDVAKATSKCSCRNGKGAVELVKITTDHKLLPSSTEEGCKPWFAIQDAGVRTYIATFRQKFTEGILPKCKGKTSSSRSLLSTLRGLSNSQAHLACVGRTTSRSAAWKQCGFRQDASWTCSARELMPFSVAMTKGRCWGS